MKVQEFSIEKFAGSCLTVHSTTTGIQYSQ